MQRVLDGRCAARRLMRANVEAMQRDVRLRTGWRGWRRSETLRVERVLSSIARLLMRWRFWTRLGRHVILRRRVLLLDAKVVRCRTYQRLRHGWRRWAGDLAAVCARARQLVDGAVAHFAQVRAISMTSP